MKESVKDEKLLSHRFRASPEKGLTGLLSLRIKFSSTNRSTPHNGSSINGDVRLRMATIISGSR